MAKPSMNTAVSQSISIATPNQIRPSVMNASGKVRRRMNGLRIVFRIPNSTAARSRSPFVSTVTPSRSAVTMASTTAFATSERRSCFASLIIARGDHGSSQCGVVLELDTPHGPARAHVQAVESPRAALVLGHGAGGGVSSPDLVGAAEAPQALELSVALVEQPYRVAGRRAPAPTAQLDAA